MFLSVLSSAEVADSVMFLKVIPFSDLSGLQTTGIIGLIFHRTGVFQFFISLIREEQEVIHFLYGFYWLISMGLSLCLQQLI